MKNKKSSVEWLISQLQKSKDWHRVLNEVSQMSRARVDILERAKAMHREEIIDAYYQGQAQEMDYWDIADKAGTRFTNNSYKYYNETFNNNDNTTR